MNDPEDLPALLRRDPTWAPSPAEAAGWEAAASRTDGAEPLRCELRWWQALSAGRAGDWPAVSALAEAGLAEPCSDREALRLACLHCLSGAVAEAEHVLAQAVQLHGDEGLAERVAAWCQREGLDAAAARLRAGAAGPPRRA